MENTISRICTSKREWKLFERLPEVLHRHDPYFVPPFPGTVVKLINDRGPFAKHGSVYPFIAYQGDKPVGRIAAIVNRSHNNHYKDKIGFFGFFDCIEDKAVARCLFETAEKKLKEVGMEQVRGPYNPSINEECGLLVQGYETSPFVLMPYNPPYYGEFYQQAGLSAVRDLYAFYLSSSVREPERMKRVVERVRKRTGITLRTLQLKKLREELRLIKDLYNQTLDRNWGFFPITGEDLDDLAKDLKSIVAPDMLLIAEKDGKAVGFSITIPNINEHLWRVRKSSTLVRILKFAWLLKTKHPREARLPIMGVLPEYRNSGIGILFYYETLMRGKRNYVGGELSWVEANNNVLIKSLEVLGAQHYKTYRIFEKPLLH